MPPLTCYSFPASLQRGAKNCRTRREGDETETLLMCSLFEQRVLLPKVLSQYHWNMGKEVRVGCTKKKGPRFFKVFFPGLSSKQLEISPAFRKHIQRMRPASTCLLTGPSGNAWRVDMIKNEEGAFFQKGWEEFVRDHSLQMGEFLVFEYEGRSRFSVLVFDASLCEKESAFAASFTSRRLVGSVDKGSKRREKVKGAPFCSTVSPQTNFTAARKRKAGVGGPPSGRCPPRKGDAPLPKAVRKPPTNKKRYVGVWISQRRPVTEVEITKAYEAASSFRSTNPLTVLVMRKYDVYYGHMRRLPPAFSRQHLSDNTKITFWDPTGKPWAVNYISCNGRHFFSGGWRKFALGNFLEQYDACVFELIGASEFRVHIFRVVEEVKPLIRRVGF